MAIKGRVEMKVSLRGTGQKILPKFKENVSVFLGKRGVRKRREKIELKKKMLLIDGAMS